MATLNYIGNCASVSTDDFDALQKMCDEATEITYRTFCKKVGREEVWEWASRHGYERYAAQGPTLKCDWHVAYYKSHWFEKRCYFLRWSAYEHIWA